MRLNNWEVKAIKEAVEKEDKDAKIYLFGSRVYDYKKGGDIDLLIFSNKLASTDASKIRHNLWDVIGEQKIDIIITQDNKHPFVKIAMKECVQL